MNKQLNKYQIVITIKNMIDNYNKEEEVKRMSEQNQHIINDKECQILLTKQKLKRS